MIKIKKVWAREILDSRGNPTVEVEVSGGDFVARAACPSGASTGVHEALELRDEDKKRYLGKGVLNAVKNVNEIIAPALEGKGVADQGKIDKLLIELDGTENKGKLGANSILAVSMACARLRAMEMGVSLYKSFDDKACLLPVPMMNILNGGKHADSGLEIQEFMIVPAGAESFREALRMGAEIFHSLAGILAKDGFKTTVGDEGGFAPNLGSHEKALDYILNAIEKAGYEAGKDVFLALDPASSEFFDSKSQKYVLKIKGEIEKVSRLELVDYWDGLLKKYPIVSIEDGHAEDDFMGWKQMNERLGRKIQIVGDDLFVTNVERLEMGIEEKLANAILIKLNQIGTVSETVEAVEMAQENEFGVVVSHRSGETEDSFIADLVVGLTCGQIKTGSLSRSERICKYNQLLRIEEELGIKACYGGYDAFAQLKNII